MTNKNFRELLIFLAGIITGAAGLALCAGLFFRHIFIEEYRTDRPFAEVAAAFPDKAVSLSPAWSVSRDNCMTPVAGQPGAERRLMIYRLCNPAYAQAMLEAEETRRISAILPCSVALYETENGGTALARLNSTLLAWLIGGTPEKIFSGQIAPFQKNLLNQFDFRKLSN